MNVTRKGISEKIQRDSRHLKGISEKIQHDSRHLKVKIVFKSQHTLRESLVRVKQSRPKVERNGVVYEVSCASCDHVYIGETSRSLKERVKEHRYAGRTGI